MGQSYESYQGRAETTAGNAEDKIQSLKRKVEDAAGMAADEGSKALRNAGQKAEDALSATRRFVEEQPWVALGAVAVVACAAGVLWRLGSARKNEDLLDRLSSYVEPGYRALRRRM